MKNLFLIVTLLLTGCASTQDLSVFLFTNSDVQSLLNQQLPNLSQEVKVLGLPVQLNINDLGVDIGPDSAVLDDAILYQIRFRLEC
ncbi:hypothetical protein [Alteromonas sp. 14N.309.X.WAT.G.H12]|uniref:hypothetical protein n=1 Tax=Alteromonas sp. 14N.309.X.WAT.G.H12 TaxID=3120824 RepID=UPI002FD76AAE